LDVAFIDAQGKIFEIRSLTRPYEERIEPQREYRLAVVANRGFFYENNIRQGSQAAFILPIESI